MFDWNKYWEDGYYTTRAWQTTVKYVGLPAKAEHVCEYCRCAQMSARATCEHCGAPLPSIPEIWSRYGL